MDLERISVVLRPRSAWEAIDLGFALARANWRRLYASWFAVYGTAAFAIGLALHAHPAAAVLVLWWLKPLFDRVALHVLGQAVFGEPPTVWQTLKALRGAITPGWLSSLTLYRFDMARSFNLPIWQLERQRGSEARRRAALLHKRARGTAVWLTLMCANFELIVLVSLAGTVNLLVPEQYSVNFDPFSPFLFRFSAELAWWQQAVSELFYVLAVSIVEPCYVAAGFALYLNRRTQLEAWDIELQLRRISERAPQRPPRAAAAAAVLLVFAIMLCSMAPQPAVARTSGAAGAREAIGEVLKQPEFDEYKDEKGWRYRGPGRWWNESDSKPSEPPKWDDSFWLALGHALAAAARVAGWLAAAALIVAAIVYAARYLGYLNEYRAARWRAPDALFGMDLRPESLPDDVAAHALKLIADEKYTEALGLLYRGALSALTHRDGLELAGGATEGDCLSAVARVRPGGTGAYFTRLVRAWSATAYGKRMPARAEAEALANEWAAHFAQQA